MRVWGGPAAKADSRENRKIMPVQINMPNLRPILSLNQPKKSCPTTIPAKPIAPTSSLFWWDPMTSGYSFSSIVLAGPCWSADAQAQEIGGDIERLAYREFHPPPDGYSSATSPPEYLGCCTYERRIGVPITEHSRSRRKDTAVSEHKAAGDAGRPPDDFDTHVPILPSFFRAWRSGTSVARA